MWNVSYDDEFLSHINIEGLVSCQCPASASSKIPTICTNYTTIACVGFSEIYFLPVVCVAVDIKIFCVVRCCGQ